MDEIWTYIQCLVFMELIGKRVLQRKFTSRKGKPKKKKSMAQFAFAYLVQCVAVVLALVECVRAKV